MEETFEQKVIRNTQGKFSIFKTPEVIGEKTGIPNIEWDDSDNVDAFFQYAAHLGAKVIYVTEGEDEDETTGQITKSIIQVGFLSQGVMHHINFADEDEDEDEDDEEELEDEEYEDEEYEETTQSPEPQAQGTQQAPSQGQPQGGSPMPPGY